MNEPRQHPAVGVPTGGDVDRFVLLFAQHHNRILAFILTFVHHRADADEVFQETSVVLWRKFRDYDPQRDFVPWANAIAYNVIRSYRRKKVRERNWFSESLLDELADAQLEVDAELSARQRAMMGCIDKLRPQDRELLEIYYGTTNTADWVADRVGRSVHAVYKAIKRIRRTLFACIEQGVRSEGGAA